MLTFAAQKKNLLQIWQTLINMEKKKYIRPAITVYNITPSVILAGSSIQKASDEDYGSLTGGEYYGD